MFSRFPVPVALALADASDLPEIEHRSADTLTAATGDVISVPAQANAPESHNSPSKIPTFPL